MNAKRDIASAKSCLTEIWNDLIEQETSKYTSAPSQTWDNTGDADARLKQMLQAIELKKSQEHQLLRPPTCEELEQSIVADIKDLSNEVSEATAQKQTRQGDKRISKPATVAAEAALPATS